MDAMTLAQTAKDVMNPDVLVVQAAAKASEAAAFLAEHEITGAPVVDEEGHLVGVVSVTDLSVSEAHRKDLVRDLMTPTVYTVPEDTPVADIARAMIAGRIHRVFVARQRKVVGIVTSLDLLRLLC